MAVTAGYLAKLRRSVRRNTSVDVDAELTDIIEECRLDLQALGVLQVKTDDETDSLILGAVRCFVRWKFGLSNEDAELNRDDYMMMRDEIRRRRDYISYTITFTVKTGGVAVADAYITFNGETRQTGASGTAIFYYVPAGVNKSYSVYKTGYITQTADYDVTATATVNITLIAG